MPRFFTDQITGDTAVLTGPDAAHIQRSLRMKEGDALTVCDLAGMDYDCVIEGILPDMVTARIVRQYPSQSEARVFLRLYQALPKSDKLEWIVQKATELGVSEIIPVLTSRCISRPDPKSMEKKLQRFQKIALEAAKQTGRGRIPLVRPLLGFSQALEEMKGHDLPLFFYERAEVPLREHVQSGCETISVLTGPEGGFSPEEAAMAQEQGLRTAGLGPRILRCETAPICAISAVLYAAGEF